MTAIPVTVVTQNATHDSMTDSDYAEVFAELREQHSLAQLCTLLQSKFSRALWNKYERGELPLSRTMRSELRVAVGLPLLPPTVAEATAQASPDAAVWQVGQGPAEHVIMVASPEPLTLHINGAVSVASDAATMPCLPVVTSVTQGRRRARSAPRPFVSKEQEARQKCLYSQGISANWREVINAGLDALERSVPRDGTDER